MRGVTQDSGEGGREGDGEGTFNTVIPSVQGLVNHVNCPRHSVSVTAVSPGLGHGQRSSSASYVYLRVHLELYPAYVLSGYDSTQYSLVR